MSTILSKRLDPRTVAGATLAALLPGLALAGPSGESVVAGLATVGRPDALTTVVNQTSASAIVNWSSFNVGAEEFVVFNQPSSSAVILNRVIGNDASQIFGSISANGRVFLSNPNGVLFAPGARLDVNGLVATTFAIGDDDFMAGRYSFVRAAGAPDAGVVNQGAVQTGAGGFVVLAGDFVRNDGVIVSPAGRVVLASGARATLNLDGMGLVDFAVDEATLSAAAGVTNAGQILAEGGMVVMTARVANQLVATAVNNQGLVRATRIADQGGELWLAAEGGDVANSGLLDASGVDGDGGRVVVVTDRDATLSGTIVADGDGSGAGGEVRAIAGGTLDVTADALISARGGADAGSAGGMVEVSGHGALFLRGQVDLGPGGEIVIDPLVVRLTNGSTSFSTGTTGFVTVAAIESQLNAGVDVKIIASSTISASGGVTDITATGAGDLRLEIGNGSASPLCNGFGLCLEPFPAFTPVPGGVITLFGVDINIAGAFHASAVDGDLDLENVSASAIFIGTPGSRFSTIDATSLTATAGGIQLFGRDQVYLAGAVDATGGPVRIDLAGAPGGAGIVVGPVAADGAVQLTVNAPSGTANIVVNGAISGGPLVQVGVFDGSASASNTGIFIDGSITGGAIDLDAVSAGPSGYINISGGLTATTGTIIIGASGHAFGSGDPAGVISINGGVTALSSLGDITINAVDFNGIAGGNVAVGSIAGYNVFLGATGIGDILVGTGSGGSLAGGALTANNAQIEATATGATGGRVLVGDANVAVNLAVEVVGGSGGGFVAFADAISSGGSVTAPATVTVGGTFDVTVTGDAGGLVVGTVSAGEISFNLHRTSGGSRDIEISTGDLTVTDSGSGAGLFVTLANDGAGGATIDLGNLSAVAAPVTILAHVTNGSAGDANIAIGDITGVSVHIDNEMFNNHLGSVQLGNVDAYSLNLYSRNGIIAGAIDASGGIDVAAQRGDITLGDLTAVNPGAPVSISVRTLNGVGNAITVGAITASGQRAASSGGDHGARVAIDAGYDAAAVTITGAVDITGIGRNFTDSSGSSLYPSFGSFTVTGFFGSGNLTVHAGPTATVSFAATGGVQVTGAGGAQVEVQAGAVVAAGAIVVDATPVNVSVTGTVAYSACSSPCAVTFTETYGNFGEAQVMISAMPMGTLGTIDVAAITVSAPRAIIELAGRDIATGALTATGDDMHYARTSTGTIGGAAHAFSDDFFGGDAQVLVEAGSGSGTIAIGGDVAVIAPGHAGVRLGADQVQVLGSVTADASGGLFTRSGTPANPVFGEDGPFGQQLGEAPSMTEGEFTGGFADIVIGGGTGGMCSGSCGLPSAASIDVSGNVTANAAGIAVVEINSAVTDIGGNLSAVATHGTRIGVNEGTSFDASLGLTVAYAETIDFSGGSAQIHVQGDGVLNVGGTLTASGAFANIDLGMNSGSLGDVVVNITGGAAQFTGVYDYSGTANDYSVSFDGPGPLQGFIAGPDSGGAGAITVGNITLDAVGFGAVIVRGGTVTVGAIDVHVASAGYTVFDSRVDSVPNVWTVGDAFIAVHDHTAPGAFGRATVGGPVTIDAAGDVVLLSQFDNASDVTAIHALGAVTDQIAVHIDRLNQVTCDSGSCSLGSYTPADLGLYAGTIAGDQLVDLNVSAISFGSGSLTAGGDAGVAAQFGLTGNPNGVIKSLGAVEVGFVGATGDYLVVQSGTTGAIGSASVAAGTVVQFTTGGSALQLEQSATGAGIVNVADMAGAFAGQGAELVFGSSQPGAAVQVGAQGAVNLAGESVTLFGPGGITGTAPLSAAAIATASGTAATVLDTTTGSLTVISASSATFDNSGFVGATALTLPTSTGSLSLSTSGTLDLTGPISGASLTFSAGTALNLNGNVTATGALTLITGGTFTMSGSITASSLTLDGVAGVTDFLIDADVGAITIAGADLVNIYSAGRTGATTVTISGASPNHLDVLTGGALTLAGTFDGTTLILQGASLSLGASNHAATIDMELWSHGTFSATGLLDTGTLWLYGSATTDIALSTTADWIHIASGNDVTLDVTPNGGIVQLYFDTPAFGAVDVSVDGDVELLDGFTASSFALSATGSIYEGGGFLVPKEGAGGPAALPQYLSNPIDAGTVFIEAGGDILLSGASFIVGTGDGVTGVSDGALLAALAGASIGPGSQLVSNGTFLAGGALELGSIDSAGSYLVLQGDSLLLTGGITGPSDLLVQIAPATASNTFSVELGTPGNAATNYTFSSQLGQVQAQTLVIGASTLTGDATIGLNGSFDVSPLNLIIATGGTVTDIGNVTSTGIVDTLAGLIGEKPVPVPILEEIDPGVADPAPPVDTEAGVPAPEDGEDEEDDEGEDTGDDGTGATGDDSALVTQQTVPAGVCSK